MCVCVCVCVCVQFIFGLFYIYALGYRVTMW